MTCFMKLFELWEDFYDHVGGCIWRCQLWAAVRREFWQAFVMQWAVSGNFESILASICDALSCEMQGYKDFGERMWRSEMWEVVLEWFLRPYVTQRTVRDSFTRNLASACDAVSCETQEDDFGERFVTHWGVRGCSRKIWQANVTLSVERGSFRSAVCGEG